MRIQAQRKSSVHQFSDIKPNWSTLEHKGVARLVREDAAAPGAAASRCRRDIRAIRTLGSCNTTMVYFVCRKWISNCTRG